MTDPRNVAADPDEPEDDDVADELELPEPPRDGDPSQYEPQVSSKGDAP